MKKFFWGVLVACLLVGCNNSTVNKKEEDTDSIFKEELIAVANIGESLGKKLPDEIIIDEVQEIFNGIFDLAIFESHTENYGDVVQGAGSDGNGGKIFCCKLPVEVKFIGSKASVEKFVDYFEGIENIVSFGDFNVEALEDEKYEVTTIINFLGKDVGGSLASGKREYTIKKNEIEVEEEGDTTLRNFDLAMIIRPSNSDSASISLGALGNDSKVYSDENVRKDVNVTFSNEGSSYYCEYNIGGLSTKKASIKPNGNILFDILSCDVVESDDEVGVDLHIVNNSNKKVSVVIYEDDGRVKVVTKSGSVEVKEQ